MKQWFIFLLFVSQSASLLAYQPYHAEIFVDQVEEEVSAPNLVDLQRELSTEALEKLIPIYTPTSAVSFDIDVRGLDASASFAANSTTLVVSIPNSGITETFTGGTRDESITLFKDFIKEGKSVSKLLKGYARFSPIDPIAGNPKSLMAQMAEADYLLGVLSPLSGCDCSWSAQPIVHQFQCGISGARAFAKKFDTSIVTAPLRYSYSPNLNWAFILDAPLTYVRNGGASSLFGSVGVGLRVPMFQAWSLTPIVRVGSGGSLDLCTSGIFVSTGLTSNCHVKLREYLLSLTNYVGYFSSTNFWLTGVNYNYHLHNTIFKNGFSFTSCKGFAICKRPVNFTVSIIDSYFAGDRLFIRHYDQVGISFFTTCLNPCVDYDCLSLGFAYEWGQKGYQAYDLSLIYQF